jgi:hypothetical protein
MSGYVIQALTQTLGEALTDFCGVQMTRLAIPAKAGDTSFVVERTYGWPDQGSVQVDNVVYAYDDLTDTSLTGLTCKTPLGILSGVQEPHAIGAPVSDAGRAYSAVDRIRASTFVGTATGADLDIVGRNLGVPRQGSVTDDDHYRAIIQAIAYSPRGTVYALELALNAMVGQGQYTITENAGGAPCEVTVSLAASEFLSQTAEGHAYATPRVNVVAASANEIDVPSSAKPLSLTSVRLADESFWSLCQANLPSAMTPAFTFVGNESQVKSVVLAPGSLASQIQSSTGYYTYPARLQPDTRARAVCSFLIPSQATLSTTDARSFAIRLSDGAYSVGVGCVASNGQVGIGFCNPTNGTLLAGTAATFALGQVVEVAVEKLGRTTAMLRLGNTIVQTAPLSSFPATTASSFDVGALGTTAGYGTLRALGLNASTNVDYAGTQRTLGASMSASGITDSRGIFVQADAGKLIRVTGGTAKNSYGGNNNGLFVAGFVSTTQLSLAGQTKKAAAAVVQNTGIITGLSSQPPFTYPDDLGRKVTTYSASGKNNGTYTIVDMLQDGTAASFGAMQTPPTYAKARSLVVGGASFAGEQGVDYTITPSPVTESNLTYNLSSTAATSYANGASTIRPRLPLPLPTALYSITQSYAYTGQVLDTHLPVVRQATSGTATTFNYSPAYASDPGSYVDVYLQSILAAGVSLKINYV